MLTWIIFGMNLLRPVPIEGDSVLCRSTGAAVEQRFIRRVSIQGFFTEMRGGERWEKVKEPEREREREIYKTLRQAKRDCSLV